MNKYEKLTVAGTAVGPVAGTGSAYTGDVVIRCETADVRWRSDGVDPTATDGMLLAAGEELHLDGIGNLKAIRTGTTSGVLHIAYY